MRFWMAAALVASAVPVVVSGGQDAARPEVLSPPKQDVSLPLHQMVAAARQAPVVAGPNRQIPNMLELEEGIPQPQGAQPERDPLVDRSNAAVSSPFLTPAPSLSFSPLAVTCVRRKPASTRTSPSRPTSRS